MKPVIMRMVVDLPAPFGPRKPSTSPRSTLKEMPSTARIGPKAFTRLSILIIGVALEFGARVVIIRTGTIHSQQDNYDPDPEFCGANSRTSPRSKTMQSSGKLFAAAVLALAAGGAAAQKWPTKPVHIFVPFAPGGG